MKSKLAVSILQDRYLPVAENEDVDETRSGVRYKTRRTEARGAK